MKDDKVFIHHIFDEIHYIQKETKELDYEGLMSNETLKKAIIRSLEIIGEATKNLSKEFVEYHAFENEKGEKGLICDTIDYGQAPIPPERVSVREEYNNTPTPYS